jgi:peptidoglycan/LPS O-acetylase OafA/YrhL
MALAVASVHGALPARRGVANASWAAAAVLFLAFPWLMLWWPHYGSLDTWQNVVLGLISALVVLPAVLPEGTGTSLPQRILSTRLAAWLGLISYGIYLFHLGVLSAIFKLELQDIVPGRTVLSYTLVALPVTLALAALSYYLVERPALKFKSPRRRMVLPRLTSATKKVQQPVEP